MIHHLTSGFFFEAQKIYEYIYYVLAYGYFLI